MLLLTVARKSWVDPRTKVFDVFNILSTYGAKLKTKTYFQADKARKLVGADHAIKISNSKWGAGSTDIVLGFATSEQHAEWLLQLEKNLEYANGRKASRGAQMASGRLQMLVHKSAKVSQSESLVVRQMTRGLYSVKRVWATLHHHCATTIQSSYRGLLGRRKSKVKKKERNAKMQAAVTVQRNIRRIFGMKGRKGPKESAAEKAARCENCGRELPGRVLGKWLTAGGPKPLCGQCPRDASDFTAGPTGPKLPQVTFEERPRLHARTSSVDSEQGVAASKRWSRRAPGISHDEDGDIVASC